MSNQVNTSAHSSICRTHPLVHHCLCFRPAVHPFHRCVTIQASEQCQINQPAPLRTGTESLNANKTLVCLFFHCREDTATINMYDFGTLIIFTKGFSSLTSLGTILQCACSILHFAMCASQQTEVSLYFSKVKKIIGTFTDWKVKFKKSCYN